MPLRFFFVTKRPSGSPPGPWFRLPLLGHTLWFAGGRIRGYRKLREKYGDLVYHELGKEALVGFGPLGAGRDTMLKNAKCQ